MMRAPWRWGLRKRSESVRVQAQAQAGAISAEYRTTGVGGWSGKQPWLPEKCSDFPEQDTFSAAEHSADLVIRTNYRVDSMMTGSGRG